ncbi:hypothetical protein BD560DRAFT_101233 [Blakeslea trispora]|nr:hypothetical protein BD560DRAFT_101233 [Blakeslea trispora]
MKTFYRFFSVCLYCIPFSTFLLYATFFYFYLFDFYTILYITFFRRKTKKSRFFFFFRKINCILFILYMPFFFLSYLFYRDNR